MELKFSLFQAITKNYNLLVKAARSSKKLNIIIWHIGTP